MYSRISALLLLIICLAYPSNGQKLDSGMTLTDAIQYGLEHNTEIEKSKLELEKDKLKAIEARSSYLPQINGSGSLTDNLKLQTSILPGEIFGQPGESVAVQFGTQYNTSLGFSASQTLFDASQLTALKALKVNGELTQINLTKTKDQLIYNIATAYYSAQITAVQKEIYQNNLQKLDSLIILTGIQFENGIAKKIDLDRLIINKANTLTDIENVNMNYDNQLLYLKYFLGMKSSDSIVLSKIDYANEIPTLLTINGYENNSDVKLLVVQNKLNEIAITQLKSSYLPTLSLSYRYGTQIQQNNLNFFGPDTRWFPNSSLGLNLSVPIFDGLNKHSKIQQKKIEIEQNELARKNLIQNLQYQSDKTNGKLIQNQNALIAQQKNITLAEEVFEQSKYLYKGGIGTMSDLLNAESSLKEAQINYLNALIQIKVAELEILKTTGKLSQLNK